MREPGRNRPRHRCKAGRRHATPDVCGSEVVCTFDDGNASDIAAARKLSEAGIKGRSCVLAGRLEMPGHLSRADLRELEDLGLEVGLYDSHHDDWRRASEEQLRDETVTSRKVLADMGGYLSSSYRVFRVLDVAVADLMSNAVVPCLTNMAPWVSR